MRKDRQLNSQEREKSIESSQKGRSHVGLLHNCLMKFVQKSENRIGKNEDHACQLQNKVLKTQPSPGMQRLTEQRDKVIALGTGATGNN